jgi:hypothetical protein
MRSEAEARSVSMAVFRDHRPLTDQTQPAVQLAHGSSSAAVSTAPVIWQAARRAPATGSGRYEPRLVSESSLRRIMWRRVEGSRVSWLTALQGAVAAQPQIRHRRRQAPLQTSTTLALQGLCYAAVRLVLHQSPPTT